MADQTAFEDFISGKEEITIKTAVKALDDVDPALRSLYVENGGEYHVLPIDRVVKDLKDFRSKDAESSSHLSKLRSDLEIYQALGSPDELKRAKDIKQQYEESGNKPIDVEKLTDGIRRQIEDNYKTEMLHLRDENKRLLSEQSDYQRNRVVDSVLELAELTETGREVLPTLIKDRVRLVKNDEGKTIRQFLDRDGDVLLNSLSETMQEKDFVAHIRQEWPGLFETRPSGAGVRKMQGGSQTLAQKLPSQMAPQEKAEYIDRYGVSAFQEALRRETTQRMSS